MQPWAYGIVSPVELVLIAVAWSIFRRPPSRLRMRITRWCSFEAEWSPENSRAGRCPPGIRPRVTPPSYALRTAGNPAPGNIGGQHANG
jgi:hypothetical protein